MESKQFEPFAKIYRWSREIIVSEKIDGTNGIIDISEDGSIIAGSRSRWLTLKEDNFGFCKWVHEREDVLRSVLGVGIHHGEWWGSGIQRRYDLKEKRFSLFNTFRWKDKDVFPCHVVPVLYQGEMSESSIYETLNYLRIRGSAASPGFMKPEGIVIFHTPSQTMFKKTLEKDNEPKNRKTNYEKLIEIFNIPSKL